MSGIETVEAIISWVFHIVCYIAGGTVVVIGLIYFYGIMLDVVCSVIDRFLAKHDVARAFLEWYDGVYMPEARRRRWDSKRK